MDGSSTWARSEARVVLVNLDLHLFCKALPIDFKTSNNEAEHKALIAGIRMTRELKIAHLVVHSGLQLVVNQVNETFQAKEEGMNN